jgi:hypothetical protein
MFLELTSEEARLKGDKRFTVRITDGPGPGLQAKCERLNIFAGMSASIVMVPRVLRDSVFKADAEALAAMREQAVIDFDARVDARAKDVKTVNGVGLSPEEIAIFKLAFGGGRWFVDGQRPTFRGIPIVAATYF